MTGSDLAGAFDGLMYIFYSLFILCVLFVPLGIWKAIELLAILFRHIYWS